MKKQHKKLKKPIYQLLSKHLCKVKMPQSNFFSKGMRQGILKGNVFKVTKGKINDNLP